MNINVYIQIVDNLYLFKNVKIVIIRIFKIIYGTSKIY